MAIYEIEVFNVDTEKWEPGPKEIWSITQIGLENLLPHFSHSIAGKTIRVVHGLDILYTGTLDIASRTVLRCS